MISVALLAGGLILLLLAGNLVIDAAHRLGDRLGLDPAITGLTLVAFATSAPELAVVVQSVAADDADLATGSVIGSNIANVLIVVGIAAVIGSFRVASRMRFVDAPVMVGAALLLLLLVLDGSLGSVDGAIMLLALVGYLWITVRSGRPDADHHPDHHPDRGDVPSDGLAARRGRPVRSGRAILELLVGAVLLAVAARLVVIGAEELASAAGVSELVIGLTVVSIGTSAPEIVTSVIAAARGHPEVAVGNAVGSNVFNILLVLGFSSIIATGGIDIADHVLRADLPVMIAASMGCAVAIGLDGRLRRRDGAVLLVAYVAYVGGLVLGSIDHPLQEAVERVSVGVLAGVTVLIFSGKARARRTARDLSALVDNVRRKG